MNDASASIRSTTTPVGAASDAPLISVLMPVYNAERYLTEAMQSILGQTLGDFELIVVNDGSTDDSLPILKRFATEDHRVRLISRANTGYTRALNDALAAARGRFVARMDADDISTPERFERQAGFLDENHGHVAVGCRVIMIDPEGLPIAESFFTTEHTAIERELLAGRGALPHPGAMIRREVMMRIGGYHPEYEPAEDVDLFLRLSEQGRLANIPQVLLRYRIHLKSESITRAERQRAGARAAVAAAIERRGLDLPPVVPNEEPLRCHSIADHHRRWARWALSSNNRRTARKHALAAIVRAPWSAASWITLKWVLRGERTR